LFVAYKGIASDGHSYITSAVQRGAVAVVGERDWRLEIRDWDKSPISNLQSLSPIRVPNGREAFAWLCAAWHGFPAHSMKVIGVTGTDGKTTTSNILFAILKAAGIKAGLISTVNAVIGERVLDTGLHVTTPEADDVQNYLAQMRDAGMTHCVLEVTSHGLALHRVDGCDFDVAVVTNITHEHLDLHGTREAYRAAKGRLFEMARQHVLNGDDDYSFEYLSEFAAEQRMIYTRNGLGASHLDMGRKVYAESVKHAANATNFVAVTGRAAFPVQTQLIGEFNISNILAAISTATLLGVPVQAMQAGVASLQGVAGRMERIDAGQEYLAVVDFAHTPNSLANCLRTLRRITRGKLIVAFGCAGERDVQKRPLMGKIAAEIADVIVLTAEDPRRESPAAIMDEIEAGINEINESRTNKRMARKVLRVEDRGEALRAACRMAKPGDTVVACGKGHEQSMCFGTTEYAWDDRDAMRAAIAGSALKL
jgi:UDP-N-acetylmuramoyl-L-alanyl-D-glutamate--2,6-diaminopimelate ligase